MSKKYLVYISSTHDDLKTERLELTRIVSELGAVPVTMDGFDITVEEDCKIIRKTIEDCDYFLNLTAHKYGEAAGKYYALELEYCIAAKARIPVLALIIGEKARWKETKKEKDPAVKKALEAFKKRLEGHTHDTWVNLGDLRQKALTLLSREMNLNPRRGWVPSTEAVEASVANELSRLIRENDILRSRINMDGTDIVKKVKEQIKSGLKVLATNRISLSFYYTNGENWENTRVFRYIKLFRLLTPELSTPKTAADISHFLGNILNPDPEKTVRRDYPAPSNTIKKIMSDFALLKLVKCSGTGDDEAWEMTEYGKEAFAAYRLHQMTPHHARGAKEAEDANTVFDDIDEGVLETVNSAV
jgi:hypothetical protein